MENAVNRFPDLVTAARRLQPSDLLGQDELDTRPLADLRASLDVNRTVLAECHELLQHPGHVVTEFDTEYYERHMGEIGAFRDLVRAFVVEAWFEWREGRRCNAVHAVMDSLRLGAAVRNGGLVTDQLIGLILSAIGIEFLRKRRHELDGETATSAARSIEHIANSEEPLSAILERDDEWERIVQLEANTDSSDLAIDDVIDPASEHAEEQRAIVGVLQELAKQPKVVRRMEVQNDQRHFAMLRLLMIELAAIAYRERHGSWPVSLDALEPDLLEEIPLDPFSNEPFVYRPQNGRFLLYSVGPNGRDDGGRFNWWLPLWCEGGDLCLDHNDYRE